MSLRVIQVGKRLGGRQVLDGVDLRRHEPGVDAIIGDNGSGKSTLLRIVAGVLAADEGQVLVKGDVVGGRGERALRHVGYVPEAADPPGALTVGELLALVRSLRRAPAPLPSMMIDRLGVTPFLGQRVATLSLGQRRRACLAAALVGEPWLLVLDEPTNGLDPAGVDMLAGIVREHVAAGGAILLATHDLAFAGAIAARIWPMAELTARDRVRG